ncbi:MAG TPA: DUF1559 domain-containing protein, partial [Planctomycetia bacterium]|nr:DUF1559 domain-containing protein [Planctomycetia bacterium]
PESLIPDGPHRRIEKSGKFTVVADGSGPAGVYVYLSPTTIAFGQPGERIATIFSGPSHAGLEKLLADRKDAAWVVAVSGAEAIQFFAPSPAKMQAMFQPITSDLQTGAASITLDARLSVELSATYSSAANAKTSSETLSALALLGRNLVTGLPGAVPPQERETAETISKLAQKMLAGVKVEVNDVNVKATASVDDFAKAAPWGKLLGAMKSDAEQAGAFNSLKQIGLAFHNYADTYRHFPAATGVPEGKKFPVSWRVLILPFIEHEALFREYRMDEPWDGPNNIKLAEKMPRVYAGTSNPSKSETPYRTFVGPGALFNGDKGPEFKDILDGMSNTIMVVETNKKVIWTKPEELPFGENGAPDLPGGVRTGGFAALVCDGSVRMISDKTDLNSLKAMITRAGGEVDPFGSRPQPSPTPPIGK